jgi:dephospho-CoA kinase
MTVIGLIGRIGAGKSTVAARFAAHGARIIDADRIAHEVLEDAQVVEEVRARFGAGVLDDAGHVRRRLLADRVFGTTPDHAANLAALEAIVHPRVHRRIAADLAAARSRAASDPGSVVVLDVPLLTQAGWAEACDLVVMVECAEEIRRQRLTSRHWTPAEQTARDAAWSRKYTPPTLPTGKIVAVDASGDLAYTLSQVDRIWSGLSG